eukprot:Partr_v1_DN22462_c0_g1_i4_m32231 putative Transcription elongation factor B (SIII), polypeptide 1 (15kDa, elongin C)
MLNDGVSESQTVKLISSDGFEFIIPRSCALASGTLRSMLSSPGLFAESIANEIHLREFKAVVLEKVVQYLIYKTKYSVSNDNAIPMDIPDFPIEPEIAMVCQICACNNLD